MNYKKRQDTKAPAVKYKTTVLSKCLVKGMNVGTMDLPVEVQFVSNHAIGMTVIIKRS